MSAPATPASLTPGDPDQLRVVLAAHPFCADLDAAHVHTMARAASQRSLPRDAYVLRRGQPADALGLILEGDVAREIADAGADTLILETLHAGDPVGWSWLFPPHRWAFDARCLTDVEVVHLDAVHLRAMIAADPVFGRDLTQRIGQLVVQRLQFTRAQLVGVHRHDRS